MNSCGARWCILSTQGRSTLVLAESLAEDGFSVWTPIETRVVTVPRMTARREVRTPLMKGFVFAREQHLVDLLELAAMPVRARRGAGLMKPAHARFSVLHAFGRIPLVKDQDLVELRRLEARRTPRKIAEYAYPRSQRVKVKDGPAQGKSGVVIKSTPAKTTILCTGYRHAFEIPTSFLEPDSLEEPRLAVRLAA